MTIPLSGYLGLIGLVGTGTAAGVIYTNLQNQTPYIDRLFEEIKQDIEGFASRYPSAKAASEASYASNDQQQLNSKEEILVRWMNFWLQLSNKYSNVNTQNSEDLQNLKNFENENAIKDIIKKLKKLSESEFKKIYEKMKKFVLLVEKPKNSNDDYANRDNEESDVNQSLYVKKIQELLSKLQSMSPTTTN